MRRAWDVHGVRMGRARGVHGTCMGCAWGVQGACMGCAWDVHGVRMGRARGVHGACRGCAWSAQGGGTSTRVLASRRVGGDAGGAAHGAPPSGEVCRRQWEQCSVSARSFCSSKSSRTKVTPARSKRAGPSSSIPYSARGGRMIALTSSSYLRYVLGMSSGALPRGVLRAAPFSE